MRSGKSIRARKGVILATGTYSANPQMSWEFEQLPGVAQEASSLAPASLTGDGLVLGAEIGGILHKIENSLRVMLSYTIPPEMPGGTATCVHAGIVEMCSPHTMVVNRYGRRFADETFFQGIVPQLRWFDPLRHEYPNLPAYLIFDTQYLKKYSFANQPVGSDVPKTVSRAGNLSELAAKLGIDRDHWRKRFAASTVSWRPARTMIFAAAKTNGNSLPRKPRRAPMAAWERSKSRLSTASSCIRLVARLSACWQTFGDRLSTSGVIPFRASTPPAMSPPPPSMVSATKLACR